MRTYGRRKQQQQQAEATASEAWDRIHREEAQPPLPPPAPAKKDEEEDPFDFFAAEEGKGGEVSVATGTPAKPRPKPPVFDEEGATTAVTTTPPLLGTPLRSRSSSSEEEESSATADEEEEEEEQASLGKRQRPSTPVQQHQRTLPLLHTPLQSPLRKRPSGSGSGGRALLAKAASMMEIAELSGKARLMDELEYALDGTDSGPAIRRESCVRMLELCRDDPHDLGLLLRSQGLFSRLYPLLQRGAASEDDVVSVCVSGLFLLLLVRDEPVNASYLTAGCVKFLADELSRLGSTSAPRSLRQVTAPSPHKSPLRQRTHSAFLSCAKQPARRATLGSTALGTAADSLALLDATSHLSQAQTILASAVPSFAALAPEKLTPAVVALECAQVLSGSQHNSHVRDDCRRCGMIEAVVDILRRSFSASASRMWEEDTLALHNLENCLHILENVTFLNKNNQEHVVDVCGVVPVILGILASAFGTASHQDSSQIAAARALDVILAAIKVLMNATEDNEHACLQFAQSGGIDLIIGILTSSSELDDTKFDAPLLALGLLINITEHCAPNRDVLRNKMAGTSTSLIQHVAHLFKAQSSLAGPDAEIESISPAPSAVAEDHSSSSSPRQHEPTGVEHKVFASYCALLLGCLARDNAANRRAIEATGVPTAELAAMLREFVAFQAAAGILSSQARTSYLEILAVLEEPSQQSQ